MRCLLIDDDADTHDFLTSFLAAQGFEVRSAYTGSKGLDMLRASRPDLVILDVQLPQMDGWQVCQRIRSFSSVPILMISAVARQDEDIVHGLNAGADDYLVKPLRLQLLNARIHALLRRSMSAQPPDGPRGYVDHHLMVDFSRELVHVRGQRVALSDREYRLLELLIANKGYAVPLAEIVEELWPHSAGDSAANYVRIYIKRLRDVIEPEPGAPTYILTEHGLGYRFSPQDQPI